MARTKKTTLKVKLNSLIPIWGDPITGVIIRQGQIFDCGTINNTDSIMEAIKSNKLKIVEQPIEAIKKDKEETIKVEEEVATIQDVEEEATTLKAKATRKTKAVKKDE